MDYKESRVPTFDDLIFEDHPSAKSLKKAEAEGTISEHVINDLGLRNAKQATITFANGYTMSVLFGNAFYSDEDKGLYEVAVYDKYRNFTTSKIFGCISDDVIGFVPKDQINELLKKVYNYADSNNQ